MLADLSSVEIQASVNTRGRVQDIDPGLFQ
jgi:hypothetical protein